MTWAWVWRLYTLGILFSISASDAPAGALSTAIEVSASMALEAVAIVGASVLLFRERHRSER